MDYMNYATLGILLVVLASSFATNSKLAVILDELRRLNEKMGSR